MSTPREPSYPSLDLPQALERARLAQDRGALPEAESLYRTALTLAPEHAGAWEGLAAVLQTRGAAKEAEQARAQAAQSAIVAAGKTAASLIGTPMEARAPAILRKTIAAHPSVALGPLALAEVLRQLGDL